MSNPRDRDPAVMPVDTLGVVLIGGLYLASRPFVFAARQIGRAWDWYDRQRSARR